MKTAVLYARVSSREQSEGYSIPAQQKLLRQYAEKTGIRIIREFIDVESAKASGRKEFGNMVRFFQGNLDCRIVLVEKTDRLYRNFRDAITFEDLKVEIHLVKESTVISEDSKSHSKLVHGFHVLLARNYSENLREEVKKGMREKAEQGIFPGKAPFGYRNNPLLRNIEEHPEKSRIAVRMFELYASGKHSLGSLRDTIRIETGIRLSKAYFEKLLKNRFYIGYFTWQGIEYKGTHPAIVNPNLFREVQDVFAGHNRPKYGKHRFPFSGLLRCAHDGCTVTTELQKKKYVYYRCSNGRGKCKLPYMREEQLSDRLVETLRGIHIPDDILAQLTASFDGDATALEAKRKQELHLTVQRLNALRERMDRIYDDKLDGKIEESFWQRKMQEWREQEQGLEYRVNQLIQPISTDYAMNAKRVFELANKACFLYLSQNADERGELLKSVLLNCETDGVTLTPTYRKPFDVIYQRAKTNEWSSPIDLKILKPFVRFIVYF